MKTIENRVADLEEKIVQLESMLHILATQANSNSNAIEINLLQKIEDKLLPRVKKLEQGVVERQIQMEVAFSNFKKNLKKISDIDVS